MEQELRFGLDLVQLALLVKKIWDWDWIFGRAVKAISSLGVRSP